MKRLLYVVCLLLISYSCFSQFSAGIDFVNNHNSTRQYSNTLNGYGFNIKYSPVKRFSITAGCIRYNNLTTRDFKYKNSEVYINGEVNIIKKNTIAFYGIAGWGFEREYTNIRELSDYREQYAPVLNYGIGTQIKIYKNISIKLNVIADWNHNFIVNPGISYVFCHQ